MPRVVLVVLVWTMLLYPMVSHQTPAIAATVAAPAALEVAVAAIDQRCLREQQHN